MNRKKTAPVEMRRSWLVQRLTEPRNHGQLGDNPFSFGGGLRNGGLSEDAMSVIRPIFGFDYMGAAEFEFGAVPEALSKIAQQAKALEASTLTIAIADVQPHWSDDGKTVAEGEATIYVLSPEAMTSEVHKRIRGWATKPNSTASSTKERVALDSVLRPGSYASDARGWLELDNGFMFFADRDMWVKTCAVFGVEVAQVSA